jgi:hypothetical protein
VNIYKKVPPSGEKAGPANSCYRALANLQNPLRPKAVSVDSIDVSPTGYREASDKKLDR